MTGHDRVERERVFHDHAFEHAARLEVGRFYAVTAESTAQYLHLLDAAPPSARVLEYGCGQGSAAFDLARRGVHVTGIDISRVGVEQARQMAHEQGLPAAEFLVMNAEELAFDARSFDVVCGSAILHHLDLDRALGEVARVLADDGEAFFLEPLGHNPLINAYRRRTPHLRTVDERPLRMDQLALAGRHFRQVDVSFFHTWVLAAVPLRNTRFFHRAVTLLSAMDRAMFRAVPPSRRLAWIVVMRLRGPRHCPAPPAAM